MARQSVTFEQRPRFSCYFHFSPDVAETCWMMHSISILPLGFKVSFQCKKSLMSTTNLLSQSGRGRSLAVAPFPSLDLLCGIVCRLNFGSSIVVLYFVHGWNHISFN